MCKKSKKLIFLITLFIVAAGAYNAYAKRDLEIRYPDFGDITMDVQTVDVFLPDYIRYVFQSIVIISGFIAFGTLIYAGVKLVSSAGNPSVRKDATDQIFAAILGIAIVLGSFLISRTINPMLVNTIPGINAAGGITIYSSNNCSVGGEQEGKKLTLSSNILDIEEGHEFKALSFKFNSRPGELDVVLFSEANYKGDIVRISSEQDSLASRIFGSELDKDCHGLSFYWTIFTEGINSIKFRWQLPGIYLCNQEYVEEGGTEDELGEFICGGADATDAVEKLLSYDTAILSSGLDNNLAGLQLKQNKKIMGELGPYSTGKYLLQCKENYNGVYAREGDYAVCYLEHYGVVLHEKADRTGVAEIISPMEPPSGPYEYEGSDEDYEREFLDFTKDLDGVNPFMGRVPDFDLVKTSSITSFSPRENDQAGGVYLCEKADPRRTKEPECRGPFQYAMGNFEEENSPFYNVHEAETGCIQEWFEADGVSSIVIDGNYLVVLFEGKNFTGLAEVFKYSDSNLIDNPIGSCCQTFGPLGRSPCASSAIILPIKGGESTGGWTPPTLMDTCADYSEERCADNDNECFYCNGCHERRADGSINCSLCSEAQYGTKGDCKDLDGCYWCEQESGSLGKCFNEPVDCSKCNDDKDGCNNDDDLAECHYCSDFDQCFPIAQECEIPECLAYGDNAIGCRENGNCYWCSEECKERPIDCNTCNDQECAKYQDTECYWQATTQICTSEEAWRPQPGDVCEFIEYNFVTYPPAHCLGRYAGYDETEYLKCEGETWDAKWSDVLECDEGETCDDNEVMITNSDYPCF